MQPNYNDMTASEENAILWSLIQAQEFDILTLPEVNAELRETFNNDVLSAYEDKYNQTSYDGLNDVIFKDLLGDIVSEKGQAILSFGNVFSELREAFNNEILDEWVKRNPAKAYPIPCNDLQSHPALLSISDDDLCATCALLAYCPGERSLCRQAANGNSAEDWPAEFDEDGYADKCDRYIEINGSDDNVV
jgi:hypothetical protein